MKNKFIIFLLLFLFLFSCSKTTLSVGDSKSDFNLGFQIDTSKPENNKMILTYSLRGL